MSRNHHFYIRWPGSAPSSFQLPAILYSILQFLFSILYSQFPSTSFYFLFSILCLFLSLEVRCGPARGAANVTQAYRRGVHCCCAPRPFPFMQWPNGLLYALQILLNVSGNHWIIISSIGCKRRAVDVFDSILHSSVPSLTKEHIAPLLFCEEQTITL